MDPGDNSVQPGFVEASLSVKLELITGPTSTATRCAVAKKRRFFRSVSRNVGFIAFYLNNERADAMQCDAD
jgi:hypothetical protein